MEVIQIGYPTTFQPYLSTETSSKEIIDNVYEKLVAYEGTNIVPALSDYWHESSPVEYIFHIRTNVLFHSGSLLTPKIVSQSLNLSLNCNNDCLATAKKIIHSITHDTENVTINLYAPCPFFLHILALQCFSITEDIIHDDKYFIPSGTGPYIISTFTLYQKITLSSFDLYWGGKASIDTINITYIDGIQERMQLLHEEKADIVHCNFSMLDQVPSGYNIILNPSNDNCILGFNFRKKIFTNKYIRKAISFCFPYEEYLSTLKGVYLPLKGIIPSGLLARNPQNEYNETSIDNAKYLLAKSRLDIKRELILLNCSGFEIRKTALLILQTQLEKLNIKARLEEYTWGTFLIKLQNGEFDIACVSIAPDYGDPQCLLDAMLCKTGDISKEFSFFNDYYTDQTLAISKCMNSQERLKKISSLHEKVIDDAIYIGLFQGSDVKVVKKSISRVKYSPYWGDFYFYPMKRQTT